jgi:hypothetical protein
MMAFITFQQQWLPVSLRSWSPLKVVYSVAHYSWNMKGFVFKATYTFNNDAACGHTIITHPAGNFGTMLKIYNIIQNLLHFINIMPH